MWHKLTPLFTRNMFERIAVVDNHWSHYSLIQRLEAGSVRGMKKSVLPIDDIYINFPSRSTNKISVIYENNGPTNFYSLKTQGVDVHTFQKGEKLHTTCQAEPDDVFDFKNSSFKDKRIHGMDHKAYEKPREFESKIFSQLSQETYEYALTSFEAQILENITLPKEQMKAIAVALSKLKSTYNNLTLHQQVWAEHLHYFPDKYIPPLRIPHNFAKNDLKPDIAEEFSKAHKRMQQISEYLYEHKISENDYDRAFELFADSKIQQLLGE